MKTKNMLALVALLIVASVTSAASLPADLTPAQLTAVNAVLIEQRDALTKVHVAQLADAVKNDQAQQAIIATLTKDNAALKALIPVDPEAAKLAAQAAVDKAQAELDAAQAKLDVIPAQ